MNLPDKVKNHLTPEQAIAATLGIDPYEAIANEHCITPRDLHSLLDEWDKHPGRAASDEELLRLYKTTPRYWAQLPEYVKLMIAERDDLIRQLFMAAGGCPEHGLHPCVDWLRRYAEELGVKL